MIPILTPGARDALAWAAITGWFPKGIHIKSRSAAHEHLADAKLATKGYVLKPGVEASGPIWTAHYALLAAGFVRRPNYRDRRGRWLDYQRVDADDTGWDATLWRNGWMTLTRQGAALDLTALSATIRLPANAPLPTTILGVSP